MKHRLSRFTRRCLCHRAADLRYATVLAGCLFVALAAAPAAQATTFVTVDGHPDPVTLVAGETVTIRFDVAKAGGNVNFRLRRDLDYSGKFDSSLPFIGAFVFTDGGQDADPAPGKVAATFTVQTGFAAGAYIAEIEDITGGSSFTAPFWSIVPRPEPQAISGRVAVVTDADPSGTVPQDAVVWAHKDLQTPVASTSIRPDGSYTLPVPPGTYLLFAEWFGSLRSQRQVISVAAGQSVGNANLPLLQGQEVSGTVRDGSQPTADIPVQATAADGRVFPTRTLADGTYVLVLPNGQYRITARGGEEAVTVADQPLDGVDFPAPTPGATPAAGTIITVAGNGLAGFGGDGRHATAARLGILEGLTIDRADNLYVSSSFNQRVRRVDTRGIITTVAGSGTLDIIRGLFTALRDPGGFAGDDGVATAALLRNPNHVTVDAAGNLYITDFANNRVRKVDVRGMITTVAGSGPTGLGKGGFGGDAGPATAALLNAPQATAVDAAGNLYIADGRNRRVRKVSPEGIISTIAGGGTEPVTDGARATAVALGAVPFGLAVDRQGNVFVGISGGSQILKVNPDGILHIAAGTGKAGLSGDGGKATEAEISRPVSIAVDSADTLFFVDSENNRIRKVSREGIISTVVGGGPTGRGSSAFAGDGGPATEARLMGVQRVAIDAAGNLLIDEEGGRVRKVFGVAAPGLIGGR